MSSAGRRWAAWFAAACCALIAVWACLRFSASPHPVGLRAASLLKQMAAPYRSPWLYAAVAVIFALERLIPASRPQAAASKGAAADFLWFNADLAVHIALLPAALAGCKAFYDAFLSSLTVHAVASWPVPARFALSFLLLDFLQWMNHLLRHKVRPFWHFHAVHHSQRQMSLFTDLRVHAGEHLIMQGLVFIPLFMFSLKLSIIKGAGLALVWYNHLYHANIRTNYGPLKHVLVTPQFHRVHHSIEERHRDKNFGSVLTVWDRLFGTLYPHYDEYPETGIDDDRFPLEQAARGAGGVFMSFLRQNLYPFRKLYEDARRPDASPS